MDSSFGVIGLEDITAADQDVYAGIDKPGSRLCLHAAIYFDECPAALALNELAEPLHFPDAVLDELLSAEPWIHTHELDNVNVPDNVFKDIYRC